MNSLAIAEENLAAMVAEEAELCEIKKSKVSTAKHLGQLAIWNIFHAELSSPSIFEQKQAV